MEYEQVAFFVKIGGTVFFFTFFAAMITYVFWRKDAKTLLGAALPGLATFIAITASIFIGAMIGDTAILIVFVALILVFVFSLRFFKSVDDERYGDIANLPLEDEGPLVEQL